MHISSTFDAGNIQVLSIEEHHAKLQIRPDVGEEHMQWFYFRVSGARGEQVTLDIVNAGQVSYPKAWPGYQARISVDREDWVQAPTTYKDGVLSIPGPT